ncbi:unnamed protein product [Prorocentrum cordatum]|uniref:Uncharacterized protein n=1 Tax=Prorocentrum cordatum TaxID=2364126 RepID=A0ABN9RMS0_9DINO|nr:unnamed protein product [Polarella glacialis]
MMLSLQAQSPRDRAASAPSAPAPLRPPGALEGVAGALPRSALVGRQGAAALLVAAWAGARGSRPRRGGSGRLGPGGVGAVSDSVWEAFVGEARKELEKEDYRRESKKATPLTEKQLQAGAAREEGAAEGAGAEGAAGVQDAQPGPGGEVGSENLARPRQGHEAR